VLARTPRNQIKKFSGSFATSKVGHSPELRDFPATQFGENLLKIQAYVDDLLLSVRLRSVVVPWLGEPLEDVSNPVLHEVQFHSMHSILEVYDALRL
jgi:hypothetical protein